jgi:hypothetical protein
LLLASQLEKANERQLYNNIKLKDLGLIYNAIVIFLSLLSPLFLYIRAGVFVWYG